MFVWSPDGEYLSFTYNDHVLHERNPALDLRNVGRPLGRLPPDLSIPGNMPRKPLVCTGHTDRC